jgi:hypothetical protein
MAVWRKDRGIDVRIAVVPETYAITPYGVIVDIVNGEWPEQRPDPSIPAVAVSPPPDCGAVAMPARLRCNRSDLPSHRRVAKPGIKADVLRSEGRRSDLATTRKGTTVM